MLVSIRFLLAACVLTPIFAQFQLEALGTYETGIFDESAAEIVAFDPITQKLFVTNFLDSTVDVIDISSPSNPSRTMQISIPEGGPNSVAVSEGVVAVAVEAIVKQDPGKVYFYSTDGTFLNSVTVGALPDMLIFTPDGTKVVVANEGEPNDDYTIDPEGSVSIIDVSAGVANAVVATADFSGFDMATLMDDGVRIFGPGASVSQDLEPEYIAISPDSSTAYVVLQENNAVAIVDLETVVVTKIVALGVKDHSVEGSGLDASNRDATINIQTWPVCGMYQPDSIAAFQVDGKVYIASANEGDARDYDGFVEEDRIGDVTLDTSAFPMADIQDNENLGRLKLTLSQGDTDNDGDFDKIYTFGARSFSIWDESMSLVFDSGDDFEQRTASLIPDLFNSNNDESDSFDNRSDDKGPEPEAITVGELYGTPYAFIGLERVGGIMVYDVSNPTSPEFVTYFNNRDESENPPNGDLGPESIVFISGDDSPTGEPLLVSANEVSGTTTVHGFVFDCGDNLNFGCTFEFDLRELPGPQQGSCCDGLVCVRTSPGEDPTCQVPETSDEFDACSFTNEFAPKCNSDLGLVCTPTETGNFCLSEPSSAPSGEPSALPSLAPTKAPSKAPTPSPTPGPSPKPTSGPTPQPTSPPTPAPTPFPECTLVPDVIRGIPLFGDLLTGVLCGWFGPGGLFD